MALAKCGDGVTDIRGKFAGNVFTRDKSGLHIQAQKRAIRKHSSAQKTQRDAFRAVRRWTTDPRWVSYYIYFILNGLPLPLDAIVTGTLNPDATGKYEIAGIHNGKNYYRRTDSVWFIWWNDTDRWYITEVLGTPSPLGWWRINPVITGDYQHGPGSTGTATVTFFLPPPPPDYAIPGM